MTESTATPSDVFSLPTDADTQRVTVSNWKPDVTPRMNLEELGPSMPCVPENYQFDPAPWEMLVGTAYNFTSKLDGPSDQLPTSQPQPGRPIELYLRGVMFVWQSLQADSLFAEPPKARHVGREFEPHVWKRGTPTDNGTPASCVRFALDIDMLPDSPGDPDTPLVFVPRPETPYIVLILDASVRREPSSSTLSSTPTPTAVNSSSKKSSSNAGKIVPAVLIPLLLLIAIAVGLFFWRKKRRERMAPSAAFRAQHPHGVSVAYATPPATAPLTAEGSELPTYAHSTGGSPGGSGPARYFPTQEKRPFLLNQTTS